MAKLDIVKLQEAKKMAEFFENRGFSVLPFELKEIKDKTTREVIEASFIELFQQGKDLGKCLKIIIEQLEAIETQLANKK